MKQKTDAVRAELRILLPLTVLLLMAELFLGCDQEEESEQYGDGSQAVIDKSNTSLELDDAGFFGVSKIDYALDVGIDNDVFDATETDLSGRIYLPNVSGAHPLLVFLHGNHSTCGVKVDPARPRKDDSSEWTISGTCPAGYSQVESHLGYDYAAEFLAGHGHIVVSVNANRGINGYPNGSAPSNDPALIKARGKLVLKHLRRLSLWNSTPGKSNTEIGVDLLGRINFNHVGLMGHSRGGEGVRAAYQMLLDNSSSTKYAQEINNNGGMVVEAILELAPLDSYANDDMYNASGADWAVVIAGCDRDLYDFQGTGTFKRRRLNSSMGGSSSIFVVPGANHNYFNTIWEASDSVGCTGNQTPTWDPTDPSTIGSPIQQDIGLMLMSAFFRGFIDNGQSGQDAFQKVFDPRYEIPKDLSDAINADPPRENIDPQTEYLFVADSYVGGTLGSTTLSPSITENIRVVDDSNGSERILTKIEWDTTAATGVKPYLDVLLSDFRGGKPTIPDHKYLNFSLALNEICGVTSNINDFSIQLIYEDSSGNMSTSAELYTSDGEKTLSFYGVETEQNLNASGSCNTNFGPASNLPTCINESITDAANCTSAGGDAFLSSVFGECVANATPCPSGFDEIQNQYFVSNVAVGSYHECVIQLGGSYWSGRYCFIQERPSLLHFRQIPLELKNDFKYDKTLADMTDQEIIGVRFVFDKDTKGSVYLDSAFSLEE